MVLLKQRFALAHVNVTDLPSSQCVASAGSYCQDLWIKIF